MKPLTVGELTIIGGDFFAKDENGSFFHTLGTLFPGYCLLVIGHGGIHGDLINAAIDYLTHEKSETRETCLLDDLCADAISINFSKDNVIVRMEPNRIELAIQADEMLQGLAPKSRIQFTGLHLAEVRNALRLRGEIWRMAPVPLVEDDFIRLICRCRVTIGTGVAYLYNRHTGEHILTYQEFIKIGPLLRTDILEAAARLREIVLLHERPNRQGYMEVAFFLAARKRLEIAMLHEILLLVESGEVPVHIDQAEMLFDRFSRLFAARAGHELTVDNPKSAHWRTAALSRLFNIDEKITAEWALGLGKEFYLNIQWLPGARLTEDKAIFETDADPRVRSLINYYLRVCPALISINVGRVLSPLTRRKSIGEMREVYIVTLGLPDGRKDIRHVRMCKWEVKHRLAKGVSMAQAIHETMGYRKYIIDRLAAAQALQLPVPEFREIFIEDHYADSIIPIYYFERAYIPGMVTCSIPSEFYIRTGFLASLAKLMGAAAAASMVLGRKEPGYPALYFDDGDEVIHLNDAGLPERLIIIETTGSFADWTTPLADMAPYCLRRLAGHMAAAWRQGVEQDDLRAALDWFVEGLIGEIQRMQDLLAFPGSALPALFSDRTNEPGGIRNRWEGILHRLRHTDLGKLRQAVEASDLLSAEDPVEFFGNGK